MCENIKATKYRNLNSTLLKGQLVDIIWERNKSVVFVWETKVGEE